MKTLSFQSSCHPSVVAMRKVRRLEMDLQVRILSNRARENIEQEILNTRYSLVNNSAGNFNHWTEQRRNT